MSALSQYHEKFIQKLSANKVDFILIGGHAAIYYGVNRTTSDVDILIKATRENGFRILKCFQELDLNSDGIEAEDFESNLVLSFGEEPHAVDILNYCDVISMDVLFDNSKKIKNDKLEFRIIDIRDLLTLKMALKREGVKSLTDQQDIIVLKKIIATN